MANDTIPITNGKQLAADSSAALNSPRRRKHRPPRILPAMMRAKKACAYCDFSLASWWRYDSAGLIPAGLKIAGVKLWRRRELLAWMEASCPPRVEWEALKARARQ